MHFDVTNFRRYLEMLTNEDIEVLLGIGRTVIAERRTAAAMGKATQEAIECRLQGGASPFDTRTKAH